MVTASMSTMPNRTFIVRQVWIARRYSLVAGLDCRSAAASRLSPRRTRWSGSHTSAALHCRPASSWSCRPVVWVCSCAQLPRWIHNMHPLSRFAQQSQDSIKFERILAAATAESSSKQVAAEISKRGNRGLLLRRSTTSPATCVGIVASKAHVADQWDGDAGCTSAPARGKVAKRPGACFETPPDVSSCVDPGPK